MIAKPNPTTAKRDISVVLSGIGSGSRPALEDHPHRPEALLSLLAHIHLPVI